MIRLSNLIAQIKSQKNTKSNRIPIVGCRIESLNCRITPRKCSNHDLNHTRDWDLLVTAEILHVHYFTICTSWTAVSVTVLYLLLFSLFLFSWTNKVTDLLSGKYRGHNRTVQGCVPGSRGIGWSRRERWYQWLQWDFGSVIQQGLQRKRTDGEVSYIPPSLQLEDVTRRQWNILWIH